MISILTLYVFGLTLADFCNIIKPTGNYKDVIPFISMFLSIGILILSLLEGSQNYQIKSERLHNCSKEIAEVYNELRQFICTDAKNVDGDNKLSELTKRYEFILSKYTENHDPIDYELFQTEHRKYFNIGWVKGKIILLKSLLISYWLYVLLIFTPALVLYIILIK